MISSDTLSIPNPLPKSDLKKSQCDIDIGAKRAIERDISAKTRHSKAKKENEMNYKNDMNETEKRIQIAAEQYVQRLSSWFHLPTDRSRHTIIWIFDSLMYFIKSFYANWYSAKKIPSYVSYRD